MKINLINWKKYFQNASLCSGHYSRIESSLSNPLAGSKGFHDCYHNHSLTNLRDLKDPVSFFEPNILSLEIFLSGCNVLHTKISFGNIFWNTTVLSSWLERTRSKAQTVWISSCKWMFVSTMKITFFKSSCLLLSAKRFSSL